MIRAESTATMQQLQSMVTGLPELKQNLKIALHPPLLVDDFLFEFLHIGSLPENPISNRQSRKKLKKINEIRCLVPSLYGFAKQFGYETIMMACSASGKLETVLANYAPHLNIVGIELRSDVAELANRRAKTFGINNVNFIAGDIFDERIESIVKSCGSILTASLHACGLLTDRLMELGTNAGAGVFTVPCCYGKIDRENFPRSKVFSERLDKFEAGKVCDLVTKYDSALADGKKWVVAELVRAIIDADRLHYLNEKDYSADTVSFRQIPLYLGPFSKAIMGTPVVR